MKTIFAYLLLAVCLSASNASGQTRPISRLFWQDDATRSLRYGDIQKNGVDWSLQVQEIEGFPALDPDSQSLVQMQTHDGIVLLGVHEQGDEHGDDQGGSGWIAIESGAVEEPHGDHSHWHFKKPAKVLASVIDAEQGNPAHVYLYDGHFVMANDKRNGFTITTAKRIRDSKSPAQATDFHSGGNSHITLALAGERVVYATWIASDGDNAGRVDVIGLGENRGKSYHIKCPSGGLHGATANQGRVFFAPMDGIGWVDADLGMTQENGKTTVQYLSLGESAEGQPLRTGAFTTYGKHVLFTAGKGKDSRLCWIDASAAAPKVSYLSLDVANQQNLSSPVAFRTRTGQSVVCLFREDIESPENDEILFIDLDPDRDGIFDDAALMNSVPVGKNQIEGHSGHHEAVLLGDRRHLAITNPGDASIWIISLADRKVQAKIAVGGQPTRLLAIGG